MLRRLGVRGKILATLAVPLLALVIGAAILSISSITSSQLANATSQVVDSLRMEDKLTQALQAERTAAFNYILERPDAQEQYEDAKAVTDTATRNLNIEVDEIDLEHLDGVLVTAIDDAKETRSSEQLNRVRELFDDSDTVLGTTIRAQYGLIIESQMEVAEVTADRMLDRDLSQAMNGYNAVDRTINQTSLDAKLVEVLLQDDFDGLATEQALRSLSVDVTDGDTVRRQAEVIVNELGLPGVRMPVASPTYSQVRVSLATASPSSASAAARLSWPQLAETEINEISPVRDAIRDEAIRNAQSNSGAQTQRTIITISVAFLALAISDGVAMLVARRITGPLIRLTAAAAHVREELPRLVEQVAVPGKGPVLDFDRIPIESEDEIGRLAEAFNEVNATTMEIAREQAVLRGSIAEIFVNVARRDQVLLSRQLSFLDELERSEEDPNILASLFRLDHLATRMRRNAESLLVLAGIESGRRVRDPMPLSDVIRTAASEIEQYDRVQLEIQTDPRILAHNALLAAHLLAELLENATVFSDPGSPVSVSESEDDHWITIVIRDRGLGMTQDEIDEANEKASTYATGEIAGQSRLGLYVVGRLAYRLGAKVRFTNIPEGGKSGIEARVMLPRQLFLTETNLPLPEPLDPLNWQTQAATEAWIAPEPDSTAGTLQSRPVEPEAPVGIPVDLPALTDGSTGTGMPRRRSRALDPAAPAPSESLSSADDQRQTMLPPLHSTELPSSFTDGAGSAWIPISAPEPQGLMLPSRTPATSIAPEGEDSAHVESAPVPKRASMFSNLRTRRDLDEDAGDDVHEEPVGASQHEPAPQIDVSQLRTRTARREALSAVSAYTGEYPVVQAAQLSEEPQPPVTQPATGAAQFAGPELVEDPQEPVTAEEPAQSYVEPAASHPVQVVPEYQQDQQTAYDAPPAAQNQEFSTEAGDYPEPSTAQTLGDPFNGMNPPDATAPLPDFSDLVGRTARREAAEADRKGFFGFGRRKKKLKHQDDQPPAAVSLPQLPDHGAPAPAPVVDLSSPPGSQGGQPAALNEFHPAGGQFRPAATVEPDTAAMPAGRTEQSFEPLDVVGEQAWIAPQVDELQPAAPSVASAPFAPVHEPQPSDEPPARGGRDGHALAGFFSGTRKSTSASNSQGAEAAHGLPSRTRSAESQVFEPEGQAVLPEMNFNFTPEPQEDAWAPTMNMAEGPSEEGFAPGSVDPSAQFALQAGIQEQALSELSQLSAYRPNEMGGGGSNLTKRVRSEVPDSTDDLSSQKISRDAAELRTRLSSFVSATSRARDDAEQNKNKSDGVEQDSDQAAPDHAPQSH